MSTVIYKRNNMLRELVLKLSYTWKLLRDSLDVVLPNSTPGYYNTALGLKRALKWKKRLDDKTTFQTITFGTMASIFGGLALGNNPSDPIALFFVIWGASGLILLALNQHYKDEEQDKALTDLKKEYDERITNMEREILKIRNLLTNKT